VISKGRWESRTTSRALDRLGVKHRIVVEKSEYGNYLRYFDKEDILVLPQKYKDEYVTYDDLGDTKAKGSGGARNFCWEHSISEGSTYHWILDDNLEEFYRLNRNMILPVRTGAIFRASEDFVERYENVYVAGMNYNSFCKATDKVPPYLKNTKVYSCLLIRNDIPYKWQGRYNEDVDLCLRILKDGYCTIQFNAFLCGKVTTQRMKGGNTDELYIEGTRAKSQMLADQHPDIAEVVWKFGRWHHNVDYSSFKKTPLIRKKGMIIPDGINNYGMIIKDFAEKKDTSKFDKFKVKK